jgi:hypothetical protein
MGAERAIHPAIDCDDDQEERGGRDANSALGDFVLKRGVIRYGANR